MEKQPNIIKGANVRIGLGTILGALPLKLRFEGSKRVRIPAEYPIIIGDNVDIGANCVVNYGCIRPTTIEEDVWIGHGCIIGHDVTIKKRAVLSAGVIVNGESTIEDLVKAGMLVIITGILWAIKHELFPVFLCACISGAAGLIFNQLNKSAAINGDDDDLKQLNKRKADEIHKQKKEML